MADFSSGISEGSGRLIFASAIQATVVIDSTQSDVSLPDVTITVPNGVTIDRVIASVSYRKAVETSAVANAVNVAQQIQVRKDTPGTFTNAITIADNALAHAASATEGGQTILGDNDLSDEVDGSGTYNFQWTNSDVDGDSLTFHDFQCFITVEYSNP